MAVTINASTSTGLVQSADTSGQIELQTNGTTVATVNTSNNVQFRSSISVGNATPTTSGAGITFPATQSASTDANTLDDYEEGTFSPTIVGSTTAGTASYAAQNARYTKIGRMIYVEMYLSWSGGTGTGFLRVAGLPFTSSNTATYPSVTIGFFDGIPLTANNFPLAYVNNNSTNVAFIQCPLNGGTNTGIDYDAAGDMQISFCYTV